MKKLGYRVMGALLIAGMMTGCGQSSNTSNNSTEQISVMSREDGSGTRGAFIELVGIEEKDADGNKVDSTTEEAMITNSTSVMITSVAGDNNAIGYISLGSLNDTVKPIKVDGVEATVENIKSKTYKVARPFNIATLKDESEATKDFITYILSEEGQKIVEENGYVSVEKGKPYTKATVSGKIVIAGSSSITPVMEKLKEAYKVLNPEVVIEIQESDSTTGMTSTVEGICDIGMASRELKESELEKGLKGIVMAMDGIAVIVNNENPVDELSVDTIKDIYKGEKTKWSEVAGN